MQFSSAWNNLLEKLQDWGNELILLLPNIILAILVMSLAVFISRFLSRYVNKLIYRITENRTISSIASNIAVAAFTLMMLFIALGILNLDKALTSLLAGAGVLGLAIGLALQEPLVNLFSGVMMSVRKMYNVGDLVETNDYFGTIEEISLRSTILKLPTGERVTLTNKEVLQNPLKNYTVSGVRKIELGCGVGYDSDLDQVEEVTIATIQELCQNKNAEIDFFFTSFGGSSIDFKLRFTCPTNSQRGVLKMKSKAIKALKMSFDKYGIDIPYPIRTLQLPTEQMEALQAKSYTASKN